MRAERRFRGLTTTERDLLESTTVELMDELLTMLDRLDAHARPAGHRRPASGGAGE